MKRTALLIVFLSVSMLTKAQQKPVFETAKAMRWADSILNQMPIEDKIGQLFMVAAYSNRGDAHERAIAQLIDKEGIGGLIFFQGGPGRQAHLTNRYQQKSNLPLLIGMDAEWGLAMRLDSTFKFPYAMTLGAVKDSALIYDIGVEMGLQCKALGVHFSFSPVVDINTNPNNPIINARSFGEDKKRVRAHSLALMRGLQDAGVLACAKHFPGHGDTDADSHKTLPTVAHNKERLERVELFPYPSLFKQGLASVMVAHLNVPALDSSGEAASLSPRIVQTLLRDKMGFNGLIFTDALNMKGVSARYAPGEVDLAALKAGNDILLFAEDVPKAKAAILKALANDEITHERINSSVRRILMAKYFLGLSKKPQINSAELQDQLHRPAAELLKKQAMEQAQTLLINRDGLLPLSALAGKKIACVQMGKAISKTFATHVNKYVAAETFQLGEDANALLNTLSGYDLVLVAYHTDDTNPWKNYIPTAAEKLFIKKLSLQNTFVLSLFANPYALANFKEAEDANGLIMSYQNNDEANKAAVELIFGAIAAKGILPVSASALFDVGYGQQSKLVSRLRYGLPEEVGIDRNTLMDIDRLANEAIAKGATPGCQILIAKKGIVFYQKNFGHHTYNKNQPVTDQSVYDLASITKIAATLPFIMKMVEDGVLDLDDEIGEIYPAAKGTNKEHLRLRDVLAHQAGLQPWIPFYLKTLVNNQPDSSIYKNSASNGYSLQVTESLFMRDSYKAVMFQELMDSPLGAKNYKYSDLGYYLLKEIVEQHYKKPLDELAYNKLYAPLGAEMLGYTPLKHIDKNRIPPTEADAYFRYQNIQGTVHDQGAAMLGGVAGHAGLFSNANDLAKLMQLYLQGGYYGGQRYLDSNTLAEFTRCQYCENDNRRGAGFDKPQLSGAGPTCNCVSMLSFGHTGFTGTMVWVDPEQDIVYVFLSNRTWPSAENRKLIELNTRSNIQEVIYNAINTYAL